MSHPLLNVFWGKWFVFLPGWLFDCYTETMPTIAKPITAEELWQMPEGEGKRELVRGEVVEWTPVGGLHGEVVLELAVRLRTWAKQGGHGYVATK